MIDPDLREELLSVDGVEDAELEGTGGDLSAVRVHLEAGADQPSVLEAIQQLLSERMLRVRLAPPRLKMEPAQPPPPPDPEAGPRPEAIRPAGNRRLDKVSMEEREGAVAITVGVSDGRTETRIGPPTRPGLVEAVMAAVSALAEPEAITRTLLAVEESEVAGHSLVTVLVEGPDGQSVGSSVVKAGFPLALAKAIWVALS